MRTAETVLNVIRERGRKGLPLEDIYRQLFNRSLYLRAYGRIYKNDGAMTAGVTEETVDGMSLAKIDTIIETLRVEKWVWSPARRTYIPKPNGKKRPLGLPTWSDKLLQEVMRSILEAYYEPQFSDNSHGFRPDRSCHTALKDVARAWTGTKWCIEGDIKGCFDNIDHSVLLKKLAEKLHDNRFLRLIENMLRAGYMERWVHHDTYSGTPQGGVVSPILANIYMDTLDQFVEQVLIPDYTRGKRRKLNKAYTSLANAAGHRRRYGRYAEAKELIKQYRKLPEYDPYDPDFRRLRYVRYADDFLLGFIGTKAEAEDIKVKLKTFLKETLNLDMSEEKTLVTHIPTKPARFLSYEIGTQHSETRLDRRGRRCVNGIVVLRVPIDVLDANCSKYMKAGKPTHRGSMFRDDDFTIISRYQSELRGLYNYYSLAQNVSWLRRLKWVMQNSLLKTLAGKHKSTTKKMANKYKASALTEHGRRRCYQAIVPREGKKPLVARFGGIPLKRVSKSLFGTVDRQPKNFVTESNELVKRLLADTCEQCGSNVDVEVHHVRKLADLNKGRGEKPVWVTIMAKRQRKTLVLCRECHMAVQYGKPKRHVDSK